MFSDVVTFVLGVGILGIYDEVVCELFSDVLGTDVELVTLEDWELLTSEDIVGSSFEDVGLSEEFVLDCTELVVVEEVLFCSLGLDESVELSVGFDWFGLLLEDDELWLTDELGFEEVWDDVVVFEEEFWLLDDEEVEGFELVVELELEEDEEL